MNATRPERLADFVGQADIVARLKIAISAATKRGDALGHALLSGPPGLGKTTLARIIAREVGSQCHVFSAPALKNVGDLVGIASTLKPRDILFIDEIHRLPTQAEELLYSAMEDFRFDVATGKNGQARAVKVALNPFTLIGATTRAGELSSPFRNRFKLVFQYQHYKPEEIQKLLESTVVRTGPSARRQALAMIAGRSRGTPRLAIRLLETTRDHCISRGGNTIEVDDAWAAIKMEMIDALGLGDPEREYLRRLCVQFKGGPAGVDALAASLDECTDTIEDAIEPYLTRIGMIARTPRGRVALLPAYQHLGINPPERLLTAPGAS